MSDQWKPNPKSPVQKRAAQDGFRITYEAFDIPAEPTKMIKARKAWFRRFKRKKGGAA